MAKKKTDTRKTSAAAKAGRKPAAAAKKKPPRAHHAHDHHHDETCDETEIELDNTERETINMVLDSDKLRLALETEVGAALTGAVRKFCRQHGTPLSAAQAQNVAMVLFGD